jgi:hypothetical protein
MQPRLGLRVTRSVREVARPRPASAAFGMGLPSRPDNESASPQLTEKCGRDLKYPQQPSLFCRLAQLVSCFYPVSPNSM